MTQILPVPSDLRYQWLKSNSDVRLNGQRPASAVTCDLSDRNQASSKSTIQTKRRRRRYCLPGKHRDASLSLLFRVDWSGGRSFTLASMT